MTNHLEMELQYNECRIPPFLPAMSLSPLRRKTTSVCRPSLCKVPRGGEVRCPSCHTPGCCSCRSLKWRYIFVWHSADISHLWHCYCWPTWWVSTRLAWAHWAPRTAWGGSSRSPGSPGLTATPCTPLGDRWVRKGVNNLDLFYN